MTKPLEPSYPWQDAYFAVIFELDPAIRQQRIREAEVVMLRRARELTGGVEQDEERGEDGLRHEELRDALDVARAKARKAGCA